MRHVSKMRDEEVLAELKSNTLLSRVRRIYTDTNGMIEQEAAQGASPIRIRRLEFKACEKIIEMVLENVKRTQDNV